MKPTSISHNQISRRGMLRGSAAVGLLGLAAGCARASDSLGDKSETQPDPPIAPTPDTTGTIRVMIWSGLVELLVRGSAIPAFQKKYPRAVVQLEIGTNSEQYPKLLASRANPTFTGLMTNGLYAARGQLDGMWQPHPSNLMPNAAKVPESVIPAGDLGIPFLLTGRGISYNPGKTSKPTSWRALQDPQFKRRVAMSDGGFDAYMMAAFLAGQPLENIPFGIDQWVPHKDNIGAWSNASGQKAALLNSGDLWIGDEYGAWADQQRAQGLQVRFAVPEEGLVHFMGTTKLVKGTDPALAGLTAAFFNEFYTPEFQEAAMRQCFMIPVRNEVVIPDQVRENASCVMSLDEANQRLKKYDLVAVAKRQRDYTSTIIKKLK